MDIDKSDGGIPISVGLGKNPDSASGTSNFRHSKKRILYITVLSIIIAAVISVISFLLIKFIYLITNLTFYGEWTFQHVGPAGNSLGFWVIAMPAIGGVVVGFMVLYGSRGIQGHGIPEAMEQILTNKSKIEPIITYLKPIASAFAI